MQFAILSTISLQCCGRQLKKTGAPVTACVTALSWILLWEPAGHLYCCWRRHTRYHFPGQEVVLITLWPTVSWSVGDGLTRKLDDLLVVSARSSLWRGWWNVGNRYYARRMAQRTIGCRWYELCGSWCTLLIISSCSLRQNIVSYWYLRNTTIRVWEWGGSGTNTRLRTKLL